MNGLDIIIIAGLLTVSAFIIFGIVFLVIGGLREFDYWLWKRAGKHHRYTSRGQIILRDSCVFILTWFFVLVLLLADFKK